MTDWSAALISAEAMRGHIDLMLLSLVKSGPSYAYEMAKQIENRSGGAYQIKQTTLYSALKRLEGTGHVASFPGTSKSGKHRTYYRITEIGTELLSSKCSEWQHTKELVDQFVKGIC